MDTENRNFENDQETQRDRSRTVVLAAETMRSAATPTGDTHSGATAPSEKIPLFWQIFGGTIVSVVALVAITAFGQLTSNETDLRRDVSLLQAELVRKEELNVRTQRPVDEC